jgi:OOP family OmpA-OmpF porin
MKTLARVASCLIVCASVASAQSDEIGLNMGVTSINNEPNLHMKDFTMGISYKFNKYIVKPRVDLDYVNISDYKSVKSLIKGSVNGVYELTKGKFTPYAMSGIGYEYVNGEIEGEFDSLPFAQVGGGATYHSDKGYKFNVEGKVLQVIGGKNQNNEVILTAGVSVPVDKLMGNEDECPIKIDGPDQDRDGVLDELDQCPDTPCYFAVDANGCPTVATLRIHFDVDKATIRPESLPKVDNFAQFMLANPELKAIITGHTDSDGSDAYNMRLSKRRAEAVMNRLIALGVSPNRLKAIGMGERQPVASNATPEGKALNRRIEAKLIYPHAR